MIPTKGWLRSAGVAAAVAVALSGCTHAPHLDTDPGSPTISMSAQARTYLNHALDLIRQHSLFSARIDWAKLRVEAAQEAKGARTPADTYPAIRLSLLQLNDDHSELVPADAVATEPSQPTPALNPTGEIVDGRFALIHLPSTNLLPTKDPGVRYAQRVHDVIRHLDEDRPCGWIVDLRDDHGGSSWAMIAGLTPLLSKGLVGYFVDAGGHRYTWTVGSGVASDDGQAQVTVPRPFSLVGVREPSVAILIGPLTASAAEATLIAFHGQRSTRSFGAPTKGVPTGNYAYQLSDGALLVLTQVFEADRSGHTFPSAPIPPDEVTSPTSINRADQAPASDVLAAKQWLSRQANCVAAR